MSGEDIIREAQGIAATYAAKDTSLEIVIGLVMRCQPRDESWMYVSTTKYALPGRWIWVVLLCREIGIDSSGLIEVRMKAEMVIGEEENGKLAYLLKAPFDE